MAREGPLVLIVDDDEDVRCSVADILVDEGYRVELAADGQQALQVLRRGSRPSLILLDVMMPVIDGTRFLALLKEDPDLAPIRVIVFTARGPSGEDAEWAAADAILRKPVRIEEMLAAIARFGRAPREAAPGQR